LKNNKIPFFYYIGTRGEEGSGLEGTGLEWKGLDWRGQERTGMEWNL